MIRRYELSRERIDEETHLRASCWVGWEETGVGVEIRDEFEEDEGFGYLGRLRSRVVWSNFGAAVGDCGDLR
jgi:hypothetical protein